MTVRIGVPCLRCGVTTTNRSGRCDEHDTRRAYTDPRYRTARTVAFRRSRGRCERIVDGVRCMNPAREANHIMPLRSARTAVEARRLNTARNLEAVCPDHNPRGER